MLASFPGTSQSSVRWGAYFRGRAAQSVQCPRTSPRPRGNRRNCYRRFFTTASSRRFPCKWSTTTGRTTWSWRARALKESGGATPRIARRIILLTSRGSASRRATGGGTRGRRASRVLRVNFSITVGADVASMAFARLSRKTRFQKNNRRIRGFFEIQPNGTYRRTPPGLQQIYFQGWAQQSGAAAAQKRARRARVAGGPQCIDRSAFVVFTAKKKPCGRTARKLCARRAQPHREQR